MGENFVYILQCGDGTLYTGYAKALGPRFAAHRAGKGAKYTKGRSPLKIIYFEQHGEKGCALKREAAIKKMRRTQKLALAAALAQSAEAEIARLNAQG